MPYDQSSDMWSVGIVTYILLTGSFPFTNGDIENLKQDVVNGNFNRKLLSRCSKGAENFVLSLLEMRSQDRFST